MLGVIVQTELPPSVTGESQETVPFPPGTEVLIAKVGIENVYDAIAPTSGLAPGPVLTEVLSWPSVAKL